MLKGSELNSWRPIFKTKNLVIFLIVLSIVIIIITKIFIKNEYFEGFPLYGFLIVVFGSFGIYIKYKFEKYQKQQAENLIYYKRLRDENVNPYTKDGGPLGGSVETGYWWRPEDAPNYVTPQISNIDAIYDLVSSCFGWSISIIFGVLVFLFIIYCIIKAIKWAWLY